MGSAEHSNWGCRWTAGIHTVDGAPGNVGVFAFSWDMAVAEFYSSWWIKTNINELVFMGFINLEM